MKRARLKSGNCTCGQPLDCSHKVYCRACYASYFRNRRKASEVVRLKEIARTIANKRLAAGIIVKENCRLCDSSETEMHHGDYSKPQDVTWLCKPCHHEFHVLERKVLQCA